MIIVADTTPLLYLSRIRRLEVVRAVHGELIVPETVWNELVAARPGAPGVADLLAASWIHVSDQAERRGLDATLVAALDPGEAAAITLAELLHADQLLIDERKGRAVARARGLRIQGTLGLLVEARRRGALESLRKAIEELEHEGFRVSAQLVTEALRRVGEA